MGQVAEHCQRMEQLYIQTVLDVADAKGRVEFLYSYRVSAVLVSDEQWAEAGYPVYVTAMDGRKVDVLPQGEHFAGPAVNYESDESEA